MKTIKIFLASSEELRPERLEMTDLIHQLNKLFKCRGLEIDIEKWEYLDSAMSITRKQDDYNKVLKTCDICLVMYWRRFGDFTGEELELAYQQMKSGNKPHKIYLFFKELTEEDDITKELRALKENIYTKRIKNKEIHALKSAIIYGPNNSGKSNLGAAVMDITTHLTDNYGTDNLIYAYYLNFNMTGGEIKNTCTNSGNYAINTYSDSGSVNLTDVKITLPNNDNASSITVSLVNVDARYIVELINDTRSTVYRRYIINDDSELLFPYLDKGKYSIRITEDKNSNGLFDTGEYLTRKQAEKVMLYTLPGGTSVINLSERTDLVQDIDIAVMFGK